MRRLSSQATSAASRASPRGAAGRASLPRAAAVSTRGPSSSGFSRTTTAQYYGGGEGAPSRRPSWNTASSTATTTVPPPTMRQRSVASPAARQPQPRPVPMQMQQEPAPRAFLARSDVVDKQVIARTSGRCLGVVDHMFVDAETYRVVSVELRAKGLAAAAGLAAGAVAGSSGPSALAPVSTWGARPQQPQQGRLLSSSSSSMQIQQQLQQPTGTNLPLATLCQVGDVVLVHDERALSFPPLDSRRVSSSSTSSSSPRGPGGRYSTTPPPRMVRLTGAEVVPADGARVLGKVRGYGFDPETGELLALRFDALGVPRIPEGAMVVTEVPVSAVLSLDQSQQWGDPTAPVAVVLRPGAEDDGSIYVVSEGLFGRALEKLQDVLRSGMEGDEFYDDDDEEEEEEYEFGRRRRRSSAAAASSSAAAPSLRRGSSLNADPQFEAWREVHGQVFARYYGLPSVPRTRAELDRAMAAAASPSSSSPSSSPSSPSPRQQQQQQQRQEARRRSPSPSAAPPRAQQQRAALPPPSRGSFSDALRPADPREQRAAFEEAADAFWDDGRQRQQQQQQRRAAPLPPSQQRAAAAPASRAAAPSSWPPPPASAAEEAWREQPRQQQQPRAAAPPRSRAAGEGALEDEVAAAEARWGAPDPPPSPPSSKPNGIPIMPTRSPRPPALVRDADGGFGSRAKGKGGEATAAAAAASAAPAAAGTRPSSPPPVVRELSFGAPVPEQFAASPVVEMADDGIDGSAW